MKFYHRIKRRWLLFLCPNCMTFGRIVTNPFALPTERRYKVCDCRYGRRYESLEFGSYHRTLLNAPAYGWELKKMLEHGHRIEELAVKLNKSVEELKHYISVAKRPWIPVDKDQDGNLIPAPGRNYEN